MTQTGVVSWSKTAATNATADSAVNWAEGQAPSSVNDSARAEMASVAKWRDDTNGTLVTTGTSTAYVLTTNQSFAALTAGYEIGFAPHVACGATVTINVDGLGAKPLRSAPGVELAANGLSVSAPCTAVYATSNSGEWLLQNYTPVTLSAGQVITAYLAAKAVTYAKIQDVTDQRFLGNFSGGAAAPSEYTLANASVSGTTISVPFPPPGSFKNLSVKVASNTTVTVAADFVATTDGTEFQTTAVSATVNLGTAGAANALDSGTIAIDTWYAIWVIAKADGTTAALASTSATAPILPSGYTFKARYGWVRTIHGSATLYGTWQLGRKAQYIVGLAQTTTLPAIATGSAGSYSSSAPTWAAASVSAFVPTTASEISISATASFNGGTLAQVAVAPSSSYTGYATSAPPTLDTSIYTSGGALNTLGATASAAILLESTNIYWVSSTTSGGIFCRGWEDNI